jgi:hypothetical protein
MENRRGPFRHDNTDDRRNPSSPYNNTSGIRENIFVPFLLNGPLNIEMTNLLGYSDKKPEEPVVVVATADRQYYPL